MKLYKYRRYNEFLIQEICGSTIYFSDPKSFNDPLDCSPVVVNDLSIEELEKLCSCMIESSQTNIKATDIFNSCMHYANQNSSSAEDYKRSYTYQLEKEIEKLLDHIMKHKGILSLSSKNNSPLMWSHYADEHKGICLEFDMDTNVREEPVEINYNSSRGIFSSTVYSYIIQKNQDAKKIIENKYFYTKSHEWSYESEWRIISEDTGLHSIPFHLSAVYFGLRCDYYVMASIIKLLKDKQPNINFYKIHPNNVSFELLARPIYPAEYSIPRPSAAIAFGSLRLKK